MWGKFHIYEDGMRFYRLTTVGIKKIGNRRRWLCKCECGTVIEVRPCELYNGTTRTCGSVKCQYRTTDLESAVNHLFLTYRANAKRAGLCFDITKEQLAAIFARDCIYCGASPAPRTARRNGLRIVSWNGNGADRVNNQKGYSPDNCVPCCLPCNYMKSTHSVDFFFEHLSKIHRIFPCLELVLTAEPIIVRGLTGNKKDRLSGDGAGCRALYHRYKARAKDDALAFRLSERIFRNLTSSPCYYCGNPPSQVRQTTRGYIFNGIDRIDSNVGYIQENCVACCKICNAMKMDTPLDEFIAQVRKIVEHCESQDKQAEIEALMAVAEAGVGT